MSLSSLFSRASHQLYQYGRSLDDERIRLLTVQPGVGDKPIHCSLTMHRLADVEGTYEAVSYTWGSVVDGERLYLGEKTFLPVTANCAAAIRRLRLADRIRLLWIDAVCINQENLQERGIQVGIMASIYKSAYQVLVYLGEGDESSDRAMQYLTLVQKQEATEREHLLPGNEAAIRELFARPWFSRVWVLQEVYMARQTAVFCGEYVVSWNTVQILRGFDRFARMTSLERWPYVTMIKDRAVLTAQRHLLHLLVESRDCLSTDPRDKIFALLSMLPDAVDYGLYADYRKPLAEVSRDVATHLMRSGGLGFLNAVQGPRKVANLPSWVPDWTQPVVRVPLHPASTRRNAHLFIQQFDTGLSWAGLKAGVRYEHPDYLSVCGFRLGKIATLHETIDLQAATWIETLERCCQTARQVQRGPLFGLDEVVWTPNQPHGRERENDLLRYLLNELGRRSDMWTEIEPSLRDRKVYDGKNNAHVTWREYVMGVMQGRRLFATDTGFVGFCPPEAQEGDLVYILESGPTPYVLRPSEKIITQKSSEPDDTLLSSRLDGYFSTLPDANPLSGDQEVYAFVGEAYVGGVMDGNYFMHYVKKQAGKRFMKIVEYLTLC